MFYKSIFFYFKALLIQNQNILNRQSFASAISKVYKKTKFCYRVSKTFDFLCFILYNLSGDKMVKREYFMEKLIRLRDKDIIKVVTGVRRCGKTTLLLQFQDYLLSNDVELDQIIYINFDDIRYKHLKDYEKLNDYILEKVHSTKKTYLFLDEVQNVPEFQRTIGSLFLNKNIDIYITGSNAYLLSGELATLLSGRYIEIKMLPLSFKEYHILLGGNIKDNFDKYLRNGGFPFSATLNDDSTIIDYIGSIYDSIIIKDIITRKDIKDIELLKTLTIYLTDTIGNLISSKKIADYLTSSGRKTSHMTVGEYINSIREAFLFYKVGRMNIRGKQLLKTLDKYYLVDIGFKKILSADINENFGFTLENIVYLELLRRGYDVYVGKIDDMEIDFVAKRDKDKIYIQVCASIIEPSVFKREIAPLEKVKDHFPKYIITMDTHPLIKNGIKQVNIIDFLTNE